MMRRILPVLISSLLLLSAAAQRVPKANLFFRKGMELKGKNMLPEAMASFKSAIALNKNFDSAYTEMGKLHIALGNVDSAITNFRKAVTINPKMTEAHIALGNIYRDARQNLDSAIKYFSTAIKLDSTNKVTWYSMAWCYNAKEESEKAIPFAARALEIDNTYRPAYGELGHAFHKTKNFTAGLEQFKKNIAIPPPIDLPYFYSGLCYIELKQKDGALKMYDELQKLNPKMAENLKKRIEKME